MTAPKGPKPASGNFGTFGRLYGVPSGPKPTADQQANAEHIGRAFRNERSALPRRRRARRRG